MLKHLFVDHVQVLKSLNPSLISFFKDMNVSPSHAHGIDTCSSLLYICHQHNLDL